MLNLLNLVQLENFLDPAFSSLLFADVSRRRHVPVDLGRFASQILKVAENVICCWRTLDRENSPLYQIQKIQHGLMMVGPSGMGKTNAWQVLLAALERLDGTEGVAYVIDPKAMHKDALYGTLDQTTREWNDGLFTHILRKIVDDVRGESGKTLDNI